VSRAGSGGRKAGERARSASARRRSADGASASKAARRGGRQSSSRAGAGRAQALLRATDRVWVQVRPASGRARKVWLNKGQTLVLTGPHSLVIGDSGAVELSVDGERLPKFGKKGQSRRVRIDPRQLADRPGD
jgi:hypothetical protein